MRNKKAKILGIVVLFVAFLIASFGSLSITNLSVLDTDPSTYIIVVMLMLFVFIFFAAKTDIDFEYSNKNIFYSAIIFLIYILMLSYLRVTLSSGFLSYRIDALLFPLLLLAFIILIFGTSGAKKLYPLIIYAVFASPLILIPVLNLNTAFANLNALIIYNFINHLGVPVSRIGLVISSNVGSSIAISTTCVSLGTFVAFVMFLLPLAYLYDGKLKNKLYWVLSGTALILFLNLARMLFISLVWVFYGLGSAINVFHSFAGQLLFYAAIILMVLMSSKYNLTVPKTNKSSAKSLRTFYNVCDKRLFITIFTAMIFAVIIFALSFGYRNVVYASAIFFGKNVSINNVVLSQRVLSSIENSSSNIAVLGTVPQGSMFLLQGKNSNSNSVYIIANVSNAPIPKSIPLSYTPIGGPYSYILKNGITITSQTAYSENVAFEINYFSLPYSIYGNWSMVNYLTFENTSINSIPNCNLINYNSVGYADYLESIIYNLIMMRTKSSGFICQSYLVASSR